MKINLEINDVTFEMQRSQDKYGEMKIDFPAIKFLQISCLQIINHLIFPSTSNMQIII